MDEKPTDCDRVVHWPAGWLPPAFMIEVGVPTRYLGPMDRSGRFIAPEEDQDPRKLAQHLADWINNELGSPYSTTGGVLSDLMAMLQRAAQSGRFE